MPLHVAAARGHIECIPWPLEGITAMWLCCCYIQELILTYQTARERLLFKFVPGKVNLAQRRLCVPLAVTRTWLIQRACSPSTWQRSMATLRLHAAFALHEPVLIPRTEKEWLRRCVQGFRDTWLLVSCCRHSRGMVVLRITQSSSFQQATQSLRLK